MADRALSNVKAILLDADDTLWENNLFFLQSLEWLCETGRRFGYTDRAVTNILTEWELRNIPHYGFSYDSYEVSFLAALSQIVQREHDLAMLYPGLRQRALQWMHFLRRHPIVFMPGVEETFPSLVRRYPTIIVTKGSPRDQMGKVHRSGLLPHLKGAEVVPLKTPGDYRAVLAKYSLHPSEVIMIGNSPASDINNAKRAGIRTVYIPYHRTWEYEIEPINLEDPPTIEIAHFGELHHVLGLE